LKISIIKKNYKIGNNRMKNIVVIGLFSGLLLMGCAGTKPVHVNKVTIVEVAKIKETPNVKPISKEEKARLLQEKIDKEAWLLKQKLDQEALTNSDKKLKVEEVNAYKIDEETPLILKNQSEGKAYE